MQVIRQYRTFIQTAPPNLPSTSSTSTTINDPQPQVQADLSTNDTKTNPASQYRYVTFPPDDPSNPQNWSLAYKSWLVIQLGILSVSLTFASSISSAAALGARGELGGGELAGVATTGAFVVGIGLGAMPFAPLSELYGRLPVYTITILLATLFEIACALAPSMPVLIILRFIAGFFSAPPLANAGGSLNDIGNPIFRTLALPICTSMGFVGPILGPIIGSFVEREVGWRWCYWVTAIWNGASFLMVVVFMPETLGGALLKYKAIAWRKEEERSRAGGLREDNGVGEKNERGHGGEGRIWRAEVEDESLVIALVRSLKRPFKMLIREPILVFFSIYLTVVYTVLYGLFDSYPIVFSARGLSPTQVGLTFIPILVGFAILFGITSIHFLRYRRLRRELADGKREIIEPEERLIPLLFTCILFPAGLFWFAWTSDPKYSIWLTMMSGIPFAVGLLAILQGAYQYLMDAYGPYAASALASCTLTRYGISGLVILAYPRMYEDLGTEWAGSVFAFLALALTPVPFLFYIYGRRIRARCTFTVRS